MVYEVPFFYILKKILFDGKRTAAKANVEKKWENVILHENVRISRKCMCSVEKGTTDKGKRIHTLIFC